MEELIPLLFKYSSLGKPQTEANLFSLKGTSAVRTSLSLVMSVLGLGTFKPLNSNNNKLSTYACLSLSISDVKVIVELTARDERREHRTFHPMLRQATVPDLVNSSCDESHRLDFAPVQT